MGVCRREWGVCREPREEDCRGIGCGKNQQELEGKERDKGTEHLFEEIMAENFPNLVKGTDREVQEAQRVPNKMNQRHPHQDTL